MASNCVVLIGANYVDMNASVQILDQFDKWMFKNVFIGVYLNHVYLLKIWQVLRRDITSFHRVSRGGFCQIKLNQWNLKNCVIGSEIENKTCSQKKGIFDS